jgi:hypothetical protein
MLPLAPPPAVPPPAFAAPVVVTRTAQATWGPPALAIDEQGRRLVAWVAHGRIVVRGRAISGRGASPPSLALAPDGSAAALWSRELKRGRKLLELAIAPPGGRFGRPRRLADVHGTIDARVFAAGGRFVTFWHSHGIHYAVGSGPATKLADADIDSDPSAAAGPAGEVVAAWRTPFADDAKAMTATLPAGAAAFGPAQELPNYPGGGGSSPPEAFAGPGGTALAFVPYGQPWKLQVIPAGGAPRTVASVKSNRSATVSVDGPRVALPQTGAVAAWAVTRTKFEDDVPVAGRVEAAVQQPDGSFSPPLRLTPGREFPESGISVAATRAAAVVLWQSGKRLRYVVRSGDRWARASSLPGATSSDVAVAAAGDHLIAGWQSGTTVKVATLR